MIKFGTSGWRGIIGEDFTFQNVRLASQGIANYLKNEKIANKAVIIGYDTRFLSEKFALESAKVFSSNKIMTYLSSRDAPTPAISLETKNRKAPLGLNFTASHNPPEYNGLKIFMQNGATPLPTITDKIELEIRKLEKTSFWKQYYIDPLYLQEISLRQNYLDTISKIIDINLIKQADMKIAVDLLYGTAREYLDWFLLQQGIELEVLHNFRDPYFGGYSPESKEENLAELKDTIVSKKCQLGLATDADADRFGIMDEKGTYIPANQIIALLIEYLIKTRKWKGGVAKTVACSHIIDAVAKKYHRRIYQTPVGFKYIGELILQDKIFLGGEESAGLSIKNHIPEKDGILACLLIAEMLSYYRSSISDCIMNITKELGKTFYYQKFQCPYTEELKEQFEEKIKRPLEHFNGLKVVKEVRIDGLKLILEDGSWFLIRPSGTEQVIRYYGEADEPKKLDKIISFGYGYFLGN
jgi:phosphoglucomutase